MDISVTNIGDDAYTVTIGESEVVLNGNDLKQLLREGAKYLAPMPAKEPQL